METLATPVLGGNQEETRPLGPFPEGLCNLIYKTRTLCHLQPEPEPIPRGSGWTARPGRLWCDSLPPPQLLLGDNVNEHLEKDTETRIGPPPRV